MLLQLSYAQKHGNYLADPMDTVIGLILAATKRLVPGGPGYNQ
jgi:hypothetical protein